MCVCVCVSLAVLARGISFVYVAGGEGEGEGEGEEGWRRDGRVKTYVSPVLYPTPIYNSLYPTTSTSTHLPSSRHGNRLHPCPSSVREIHNPFAPSLSAPQRVMIASARFGV